MNNIITITIISISLSSCLKNKFKTGTTVLNEDFESINLIEDLFEDKGGNWSFYQQTNNNSISIDTINPHSGNKCLKIYAKPTLNGKASKSNLANNDMLYKAGQTVLFTGWYYIEGNKNLADIYLFDLEEIVPIGAGPGMRFLLKTDKEYIKINRAKMLESDISPSPENQLSFPRNEWVKLTIETRLSKKKKGYVKVYQNNTLIINEDNIRTLPKDKITIVQGTKGLYQSIQVGITANSPNNEAIVYIDDISIRLI